MNNEKQTVDWRGIVAEQLRELNYELKESQKIITIFDTMSSDERIIHQNKADYHQGKIDGIQLTMLTVDVMINSITEDIRNMPSPWEIDNKEATKNEKTEDKD